MKSSHIYIQNFGWYNAVLIDEDNGIFCDYHEEFGPYYNIKRVGKYGLDDGEVWKAGLIIHDGD